jgi:hypothetical protein
LQTVAKVATVAMVLELELLVELAVKADLVEGSLYLMLGHLLVPN